MTWEESGRMMEIVNVIFKRQQIIISNSSILFLNGFLGFHPSMENAPLSLSLNFISPYTLSLYTGF